MKIHTNEASKISVKRLGILRKKILEYESQKNLPGGLSFDTLYEFGNLRLELGDLDEASICFQTAIDRKPDAAELLVQLGKIYLDLEQFDHAEATLTLALKYDEVKMDALYHLGILYFHLRRIADAEAMLSEIPFKVNMENIQRQSRGEKIEIALEHHPDVAKVVGPLHRVQAWKSLIEAGNPERDLERLQHIANGRPIYITHICGNGWIFSHIISQIEMFTRRLMVEGVKDPFIIVVNPHRFCNDALTKMYQRVVWMVDDRYPRLRRRLTVLREYLKSIGSPIARDIDPENHLPHSRNNFMAFKREFIEVSTILEFSKEEEKRGRELLESFGINEGDDFITFGVRERSYYKNAWIQGTGYQDYWEAALPPGEKMADGADREIESKLKLKNLKLVHSQIADILHTPIENYLAMAENIANQGITVFRMGTDVEQKLPVDRDSKIIDYANEFRTEFGDIYLFANCKFLVSGATGNNWIPQSFGKPLVVCDYYLLNIGAFNGCKSTPNIIVPRMYWYKDEKRFLTFSEILECCRYYQWKDNCIEDNVEHVPNSPEDIAEAVDEMNQRIDGKWQGNSEDELLQEKFKGLYLPYYEGYGLNSLISTCFLRRNSDLIR